MLGLTLGSCRSSGEGRGEGGWVYYPKRNDEQWPGEEDPEGVVAAGEGGGENHGLMAYGVRPLSHVHLASWQPHLPALGTSIVCLHTPPVSSKVSNAFSGLFFFLILFYF